MNTIYNFPKAATLARTLPKSKIYEYAKPSARIKAMFVREVEKIVWSYKLFPKTINLSATPGVHEIQVFTVTLKSDRISPDVLRTIDKAIPTPIIFELKYSGKTRYAAGYKRPNEADKARWVVNDHFQSDWLDDDSPKSNIPLAIDMGALYKALLERLSPLPLKQSENLDGLVSRVGLLRTKERESVKLRNRVGKEKQFNRRVELNQALNKLNQEIKALK